MSVRVSRDSLGEVPYTREGPEHIASWGNNPFEVITVEVEMMGEGGKLSAPRNRRESIGVRNHTG